MIAQANASLSESVKAAVNKAYDDGAQAKLTEMVAGLHLLSEALGPESPLYSGISGLRDFANGAYNALLDGQAEPVAPVVSPFNGEQIRMTPAPAVTQSGFKLRDLPNGYYTVVMGNEYRTIRLADWKARPGFRTIAFLNGPDNCNDYMGIGDVDQLGNFRFWRRWEDRDNRVIDAVKVLSLADDDLANEARLNYALKSGRCAICGRMLTVPASIHRGIGPECFSKM